MTLKCVDHPMVYWMLCCVVSCRVVRKKKNEKSYHKNLNNKSKIKVENLLSYLALALISSVTCHFNRI